MAFQDHNRYIWFWLGLALVLDPGTTLGWARNLSPVPLEQGYFSDQPVLIPNQHHGGGGGGGGYQGGGHHSSSRALGSRVDPVLNPLSEDELEALLYLLDKVRTPQQVPSHPSYPRLMESRNKRTGTVHSGHSVQPVMKKKSIDWSEYLGIDKRAPPGTGTHLINVQQRDHDPAENSVLNKAASRARVIAQEEAQRRKQEKDKEDTMKQFFKNMAMAENIRKRKRETNELSPREDLEKKLTKAGDQLIWDALKLTGSHRDEKLSPSDLKTLKEQLIQKISAAYSLEKLRDLLSTVTRPAPPNTLQQ